MRLNILVLLLSIVMLSTIASASSIHSVAVLDIFGSISNFFSGLVNSIAHLFGASTTTTISTVSATTSISNVVGSSTTTTIISNNSSNSSAEQPTGNLITIATQEYLAPYCQGSSQAPVGESGLECASEINSTAKTFTNTSGAFDCAGFVQYIYNQIGIKIPRTSQAQFGNFYPEDAQLVPVPGGQINTVPGDLVYFSIPGDHDPEPAHVAMCYVAGCNTIIQNGGPLPGTPGDIAPLNAVLCSNPNSNTLRCIMGFMQVTGAPNFQLSESVVVVNTTTTIAPKIPTINYSTSGSYAATQGYNYGELFVNNHYTHYICGGASATGTLSGAITNESWKQDADSNNYSSIGTQNGSTCIVYANGNAKGAAIVGMGINVTPSLYFSSNGLQNSFNLNKNSSMLAIVVSGIYYLRFPAQCNPDSATTDVNSACPQPSLISYPQGSNCQIGPIAEDSIINDAHTPVGTIFICTQAQPGTYQVNESMLYNASLSAYTFN